MSGHRNGTFSPPTHTHILPLSLLDLFTLPRDTHCNDVDNQQQQQPSLAHAHTHTRLALPSI